MLDDRLSDFATLSLHSQRANALDLYLIHDLLFLPISTIESGVS